MTKKEERLDMKKILEMLAIKKDLCGDKIKKKMIAQCSGGGVCKSVGGGGC